MKAFLNRLTNFSGRVRRLLPALLVVTLTPHPLASATSSSRATTQLLQVPLRFEPAPAVPDQPPAFLARGHRYAVLLQPNTLQLRLSELPSPEPGSTHAPSFQSPAHSRLPASSLIQIVLLNANPSATLSGTDPLPGRVNYFRGNDPAQWRRNIPTFAKVRSDQVYPGIDLVYYGTSQDQLEYDFIVAPGADPGQIALAVEGADRVDLDSQGDLVITATGRSEERRVGKECRTRW